MSGRLPAGAVVALTRDECRLLAFAAGEILAKHRREGLESRALRALLAELRAVALEGSVPQTLPIHADPGAPGKNWGMSTKAAAAVLGISPRGVNHLLHEGCLVGRQQGTNSSWRVSEQSVEDYAQGRGA